MKMKWSKKWLYWIGGILGFLVLLNFGINFWIKQRLPAIIEEKNDTPYSFQFEKLSFSLFSSSLSVKGIEIRPKENFNGKLPLDFTAKVEEIDVVGVNFIKLLRKKDLSAYRIYIDKPDIVYFKPLQKDTVKNESKSELGNVIHVSNFEINEGKFQLVHSDKKTKLAYVDNIDIELGGVDLSKRTLEKDIPFTYSTFELLCGHIYFQINPSQKLTASSLKVNDNLFILNTFLIQTDEKTLQNKNAYRLVPEIKTPAVSFMGLDWGYDQLDRFYFQANTLKFDSVDISVRQSSQKKEAKDSATHLIPIRLDIKKVLVQNSRLKIQNSLDAKNINIEIDSLKNLPQEQIYVHNISLKHPEITTYKNNRPTPKQVKKAENFLDHILVKNFKIENATYHFNQLNNKNLLTVKGVQFQMNEITISPESYHEKIPILYKNVLFSATSADYNPNEVYALKTKNIRFDNGNLDLKNFEMKPKISRNQFVRKLKKEQDLYTISANSLSVQKLNWGFHGNTIFFQVPQMNIKTVNANIYRSKIPPDDTKKKFLYSKLLRDMPFEMQVNRLDLTNSKIEYEEESETSSGAGKLTFSNFNAKIQNINSGKNRSSTPDVRADVNTNFMNDSRLVAVWTFNPMNRSEKFNIKGSIFNFDAKKMTPFVKPYLHVTAEGDMQEVRFNFTGNDLNASGDFGVKYKNLKVTVYNKNTGKERKVLSGIGNVFVKSNTKDNYKEEKIKTVERKQDRSFFNFFWLCVQQGLKQTVLII